MRRLILLFLLVGIVAAQHNLNYPVDQVVINSKDWTDVYSGMLFSKLIDKPVTFVQNNEHAVTLANSLNKQDSNVLLLTQKDSYYVSYESYLSQKGFNVNRPDSDNLNLYLARALDINRFIIIDDAYGYNAITAAPYAMLSRSYVLFTDPDNIDDVVELFDDDTQLLLLGYLEKEVEDALTTYKVKRINEGDRFSDNIMMFEEFSKLKPPTQTVITNGEFIEEGFFTEINPVLFIGKSRVPEEIEKHILEKRDTKIFVLIGNKHVNMMQKFKQRMKDQHGYNMSIIIKFGMTPRDATKETHNIADLETFPIPVYELDFKLQSIRYNSYYNKLEVTFRNDAQIVTFFRSTIDLDGAVLEDKEIYDVPGGKTRTISYDVDTQVSGEILTIYGDSLKTMDNQMQNSLSLTENVNIRDDSSVNITKVTYNPISNIFTVYIKNIGDVNAFVDVELKDVLIAGLPTTLVSKTKGIPGGKVREFKFRANLDEIDLEDNIDVLVKLYYGVREDSLVKSSEKRFAFNITYISTSLIVIVLIALTVIMLLYLMFIFRKKDYVCNDCGQNHRARTKGQCKVCGGKLK